MKIKTIGQLLEYVETVEKARELINYINKQKEVLDKIKEYIKQCDWHNDDVYIGEDILELLEEIE